MMTLEEQIAELHRCLRILSPVELAVRLRGAYMDAVVRLDEEQKHAEARQLILDAMDVTNQTDTGDALYRGFKAFEAKVAT